MKVFQVLVLILLSSGVHGQDTIVRKRCNDILVMEIYHSEGQLKEKGRLKLFENISIQTGSSSKAPFTSYMRHGNWTEFHENGIKKRVLFYERGVLVRVKKKWDSEGNKVEISPNESMN